MSKRIIPIALRAHARLIEKRKPRSRKIKASTQSIPSVWYDDWPELVLTYRIKTIQETAGIGRKLQFGVYKIHFQDDLIGEGLFYPDDLTDLERGVLSEYARAHKSRDAHGIPLPLYLLKQDDFTRLLLYIGHTYQGVIVSHDIPASIRLLASGENEVKRGFYAGGFSFYFKTYLDAKKKRKPDLYRPRIIIKSINPRSNFIIFRNPVMRTEVRRGVGCFIDLHTLAYVFTNKDYTLSEAADVFGVAIPTAGNEEENPVSSQSIEACRGEVQTTWELYKKLMEEAKKHPVPTPPDKWYSPGSLGKAYLRAMSVHVPTLQSTTYSPDDIHGFAMASCYGGRAEMYLRNVTAPVALADFKSTFPTVAVLMGMWEMLTAQSVQVEDATEEVITWLEQITPADLFNREAWKNLSVLVSIVPDGDFLPVRGKFWQTDSALGWGYLHQKDNEAPREMWYMLPDIIASKIKTRKAPKIIKALRFIPQGKQVNLHPVKFRDSFLIDPYRDDFFRRLVEARALAKNDTSLSLEERERLDDELKCANNALAYGSPIELNPSETLIDVDVQAFSDHAFRATASRFEQPGGFYFPVIGALVSAGAHLLLAVGIDAVEEAGGLTAFADTDSICMIASRNGKRSLTFKDHHGTELSIPVMSFESVEKVIAKFEALNPYDHQITPGSILRLEPENYPPAENLRFYDPQNEVFLDERITPGETDPDLYYHGVASKRYALINKRGDYKALRWRSEAALGQWINPVLGEDNETWIDLAWHIGMDGRDFDIPIFADVPVMSKYTVTAAGDMQAIEEYNLKAAKGDYRSGIKPFEVMLHPLTDKWLLPEGDDDDEDYRPALLVTPYTKNDLQDAMGLDYTNLHDPGELWKPSFSPIAGMYRDDGQFVNLHPVTRFCNYLHAYFQHREFKMDDAYGDKCPADMIGLSYHPQIVIERIDYVGKEMPNPDRVDADIYDGDDINIFTPDIFEGEVLPAIREAGVTKTALASGIPAKIVARYLNGERPSAVNISRLTEAVYRLDENYDLYQAEILPWIIATPSSQIVGLTGLSFRFIEYLKTGSKNPGGENLEKLIQAMRDPRRSPIQGAPRKDEWKNDLLPRFMEIPTHEIAELTELSRRYVNYLKSGKRQPGARVVEKLRVAIGEYEGRNKNE